MFILSTARYYVMQSISMVGKYNGLYNVKKHRLKLCALQRSTVIENLYICYAIFLILLFMYAGYGYM